VPTSAEDGLEEDRFAVGEAARERLALERVHVLRLAVVAGEQRHTRRLHQPLRRVLRAHIAHRLRGRADEREAGLLHGVGKGGVLGEEAVARVDGLGARLTRRREHAVGAQVRVRRRRAAHAHGDVGHLHVLCVAVGLGEDGDGLDAHAPRRAHDAARNLAAVGDEQLAEHRHAPRLDAAVPSQSSCTHRRAVKLTQSRLRGRRCGTPLSGVRRTPCVD
jgi:hypothetical protein